MADTARGAPLATWRKQYLVVAEKRYAMQASIARFVAWRHGRETVPKRGWHGRETMPQRGPCRNVESAYDNGLFASRVETSAVPGKPGFDPVRDWF